MNKKYWIFYTKNIKSTKYLTINLINKKNKLEKFFYYLLRVNKPIFFTRFKKRYIIYNKKWSDLRINKYKYYLFLKKKDKFFFNKKFTKYNKFKYKKDYKVRKENMNRYNTGIKKINITKFNFYK